MRILNVTNTARYNSAFAQYFLLTAKLIHGAAIAVPGLIITGINHSIDANLITVMLAFSVISVIIFHTFNIYSEGIFTNLYRFKKTLFAWSSAFIFLFFASKTNLVFQAMQLLHYIAWFISTFIILLIIRQLSIILFKKLMSANFYLTYSVIWGATDDGKFLAEYLHKYNDIRTGLIGFVDDRIERSSKNIERSKLLGDTKTLIQLIQKRKVNQVIVALPWEAKHRIDEIIGTLRQLPVAVLVAPDMQAMHYAHNRVSEVGGIPMFNVSDFPLRGWSPIIKRLEDIIISSFLIIISLPLMIVISILIKLDSKGPVLFKQKRYGYGNEIIRVYKFRTMHHALCDRHASRQTTRNDTRVTAFGRLLRRSSLDELPQLFNVITGRMSMVGPRPHAKETKAAGVLFEEAVKNYAARHRVKPGITGWAQINGYRGETDALEKIEKRIEYDLEYIEKWSVLFDLYIVIMTIPAVLFGKEAY